MARETLAFDVVDYLSSEEKITAYLNAAFEDGEPAAIAAALADVARARNMTAALGFKPSIEPA